MGLRIYQESKVKICVPRQEGNLEERERGQINDLSGGMRNHAEVLLIGRRGLVKSPVRTVRGSVDPN
jgi:hypothetical protein